MISLSGLMIVGLLSTEAPEPSVTIFMQDDMPERLLAKENTILRAIMSHAKVNYKLELLPFKRAYATTLRTPNSCLFAISQTSEREALFRWISPIYSTRWSFFQRPDSEIFLESIEDIKPYRIVAVSGYASANALSQTDHKDVLLASNLASAVRMLYHGRVDLLLGGKLEVQSVAQAAGFQQPIEGLVYRESTHSFGCNLETNDTLIQKIKQSNQALSTFKQKVMQSTN